MLFPFFLLSVSVLAVAFDSSQYDAVFAKLGVNEQVQDAESLNEGVLKYLSGKENALPAAFNTREQQHMFDVKRIFEVMQRMIVAFPLVFVAAMIKWGSRKKAMLAEAARIGSLIALVLFLCLTPLMAFAFPSLFAAFHGIFFEEGSYLFDPSTELLVQLYPEGLFFALAWRIALLAVLLASLSLFFGVLMKKNLKQKVGKSS